ncbi:MULTISPECIES: hypothetical protein [unclassified Mesorhizobium]|uniref:hypothetical protein n=1 Tax=unclassified Mesorhizobium TaxID=325217 RepID=UPI000FD8297D|nr:MULTISPECIES: hypothetical protein [unclassified Mesorhizobium]TGQ07731.1 hypothetical protein EN862_024340 [Mesorhizobium sp. M2E.F.Ca.ET.219.01.1.1]TGT73958.1 hypothetical protein EN809_014145 [Mesorhizobium sp. M2E.F.Ca.ET.166.01.1.1]TGW00472.1 hypothetical protein EN797_020325 [Mesorhizobium sp. M2E.F.Ca.ET.154.01.1.1]
MTRSLLAASAAILLATISVNAQTTAPATSDQPAADQGAADQGSDQAASEDDKQAPIPFEGGQLTITQPEQDGEKVLAYDGKQLASNYDVFFDKIVKIGDVNVALVDVGDGGNQCGPAKVIVWKKDGEIETTTVEQDECGAPPAAVSDSAIYFVPYLLPGDTKPALQWSPTEGLTTSGNLTYTPEPGTDWKDVDPSKYDNIIDAFHNEAVYKAGQALLGNDMPDMATSLLVGGGTEKTASGAFYATGCVPHDCGGNDGFMAVDPAKQKVYFARRGDNGEPQAWPPVKDWPADIKKAYEDAQGN